MIKNDLQKIEKLLLNDSPVGANNSKSRALFFQRKLYDIKFNSEQPVISGKNGIEYSPNFSNQEPDRPPEDMYIFDFRDTDLYYGRLNEQQEEINVIENNLKQLPVENETLMALNFVVDAFNDLKYDIESKYLIGELKEEFYKELKPKTAFVSALVSHHKHMELIYIKFNQYLKVNYINKKILNFKQFLENFLYFIDSLVPLVSINRTSYISSREASPLCSGLIIELDNKPLHSDKYKYENFITSYDYSLFRSIAIKYGFRVDRHIPWRLIFDINSIEGQKYINAYNIDKNEIYDKYYLKTKEYDIEVLKRYLLGFYNSFVSQSPYLSRTNLVYVESELKTNIDLIKRQPETLKSINSVYDEFFWLKYYCFIKLREYNVSINQLQYNSFVKRISDDFKLGGVQLVMEDLKKVERETQSSKKNRDYFFIF